MSDDAEKRSERGKLRLRAPADPLVLLGYKTDPDPSNPE